MTSVRAVIRGSSKVKLGMVKRLNPLKKAMLTVGAVLAIIGITVAMTLTLALCLCVVAYIAIAEKNNMKQWIATLH